MISPVRNIARSASPQPSLNILSFVYDGYFDSMLCNALTQHEFYGPINDGNHPAGWNLTLYPQPSNFHFIPSFQQSYINNRVDFDLILCHDRTTQFDIAQQLAHISHINVIMIEHFVNVASLDMMNMIPLLKKTKNTTNVFTADVLSDFKIPGQIIKYGVPDISTTNPKKKQVVAFNADPGVVENIKQHTSIPVVTYDINTLNQTQYVQILQESQFYLNIEAEVNRLQADVLAAMSAGCVVASVVSPAIKDLITHEKTGLLVNNLEELLTIWHNIDGLDTTTMGQNASKYIRDNYSCSVFSQKWQDVVSSTVQKTYIR